jgi:hypothetical protein
MHHSGATKAHDWMVSVLGPLFRMAGHTVRTQRGVTASAGQRRGDVEIRSFLRDQAGTSCAENSGASIAWTPWEIFEVHLDILFCIDVAVTFCTAYVSRGVYHANLREISLHYLRTWFLIDFFGSVPFDKIVMVVARGSSEDVQGAAGGNRQAGGAHAAHDWVVG